MVIILLIIVSVIVIVYVTIIDYIIHESIKNERYKQFLADGNYTIITSENKTYDTIHDNTTK